MAASKEKNVTSIVYLTVKDVASILQIGKDKVYMLCALDGFPAIKINKSYRIHPIKLANWLEDNLGKTIDL